MKYHERAAPPPGGDPLEFVMSDASVDRCGDVIDQAGWDLKNFATDRNPIALFNHERNSVIGTWRDVRVKDGRLVGRLELAERDPDTPIVNMVRALVRQGILRAVSVGFQPKKVEPLGKDANGFRFLQNELLECSLVSVPANANALQIAKQFPRDVVAKVLGVSAIEQLDRPAARPSGVPAETHRQLRAVPMTLSQKIQAAQQKVTAMRDRLADLTKKDELDETEQTQFDALPDEIEVAQKDVERLQRAERAIMPPVQSGAEPPAKSGEIIPPAKAPVFALPKKQIDPAEQLFRSLAIWTTAQSLREPIEKVAREYDRGRHVNDEALNMVLRTAVNPAQTTVAGWAAELVQTVNADFMNRLLPNSIYGPLSAAGQRLSFGSGINAIKIPTRTTTSKISGAWVAEGSPKPVKKASLSTVTLEPYKLSVISTFTEEMALYSSPAIESIIRQAMQDDTSEQLDTFLIDATAKSTGVRPAGLLNGVSPLTATASGTAAEKMIADLKQLVAAILAAGGGRNIVMLINPAQALSLGLVQTTTGDFVFGSVEAAGQKINARFIVSQTVAAGRVIAIDAADFVTATGDAPRFAVSTEATIHEEDTTPLAIGTTGSPATVAAPARSLFQTDSVAIRMSMYVTWIMRRTGMVQTIASVGW
jgi:HK97 family phage major capsid protein/HK97 family phage prohead protease